MKNFLCVLLLIAVFPACNSNLKREHSANFVSDSLQPMVRPVPYQNSVAGDKDSLGAMPMKDTSLPKVRVVIRNIVGYGPDSNFAVEAAHLLENVVNSAEFREAVINNSYSHDNGYSTIEIYNKIMKAHEESNLSGNEDGVIDLRLRVITLQQDGQHWLDNCEPGSSSGTIGIDGAGSGIAAVCPQWLRSTAANNRKEWLAAHFMHEYMHILGFRHPNRLQKSVPYRIHYIIERLGENLASSNG